MVFKYAPQGEIIVSKKPDMANVVWREAQRERFRPASAYATRAKAGPKVGAKYERRAKRLNNCFRDLAISDYFQGKNLLAKK